MNKLFHFFLIVTLLIQTSLAAAPAGSLNALILEHDYLLNSQVLTKEAQAQLQEKFETKLRSYLSNKSDSEVLSEVKDLVSEMPEGSEKKNFLSIIAENQTAPSSALREIVSSRSFENLKSGQSANWSVFENFYFLSALAGVLLIAAVLLVKETDVVGKMWLDYKKDQISVSGYAQPKDGYVSFYGSDSESRSCWYEETKNSDGTVTRTEKCEDCSSYTGPGRNAKEDAERNAYQSCYSNPIMNRALCDSGSIYSSTSESGSSCSGSATLSIKI